MLKLVSNEQKLDFDDVLIVPQRSTASSRKDIDLIRKFQFYHSNRNWEGLPIMVANMACTGTEAMSLASWGHKAITCLHKDVKPRKVRNQYSFHSIGMIDPLSKQWDDLVELSKSSANPTDICIDVANGYSESFVEYCGKVRGLFPNSIIMAGNVCTPEMVQELIISGGVDIVKIGIGPGSACTTRIQTGVGYPQLSSIAECASAAHGLKSGDKRMGLICADGGCRSSGDICKAFCAGADFVMLGGMFAGTDQCEGDWTYHPTTKRKKSLKFYGMSSFHAQEKHNGGKKEYRGSEGRVVSVPYKGDALDVFLEIQAGIRSSCSYIGADCIKDMNKCAKFVRIANGNTHNRIFENNE